MKKKEEHFPKKKKKKSFLKLQDAGYNMQGNDIVETV